MCNSYILYVMSNTIAIQGNTGSFHDQAARQFFGTDYEMQAQKTFRDVFMSVERENADYGVIAIENSLHGSINPVYRLLANQKVFVIGEVRLKIDLYLISANRESTDFSVSSIHTVISQAEAISQCEEWLQHNLPLVRRLEFHDTADAVKESKHVTHTAAIASKRAADIHAGKIIAGPINDDPHNYTRFFIISTHPSYSTKSNRSSIIISEKDADQPGNLHDALGIFADLAINLSKIDSHPLPGKLRTYAFYLDFDASAISDKGSLAIKRLQEQGWNVSVLGTYERAEH